MNTAPDHIDNLIANYLTGEASQDEIARVEEWIDRSESNRRYFGHLKLIFEKAAMSAPNATSFDTDHAWLKLQSRLGHPRQGRIRQLNSPFSSAGFMLRVAAGIVILLAVGIFTFQFFRDGRASSVELVAGKDTESDTLPDGSGVFLNRQTSIEYILNKKDNTHIAKLVGEAYFNIQHDDEKTFIVEAEGTFIRDIGTSFNVKAYPHSSIIEVVVEEGEVIFYTEGNPGIYLKANGKGIYNKDTKTFSVAEPEPNVAAYKTKFFSFTDNSLETVVETLNDVYPVQLRIDDHLKTCRLTVSFNNESIDEIAGIIAETLGLTMTRSGNMIALKGSGCGEARP